MPGASEISKCKCSCGKTLSVGGQTKCPGCGKEHPAINLLDKPDLVIQFGNMMGVDWNTVESRLWPDQDWIEKLVAEEMAYHKKFFGFTFDFSLFRKALKQLGYKRVTELQKKGLKVCYFPRMEFVDSDRQFPGWRIRPDNRYWDFLHHKDHNKREALLYGGTYLVDIRLKPIYDEGRQMFSEDKFFLGNIISGHRRDGRIKAYQKGPRSSRFGISPDEFWHIFSSLAEIVPEADWRLETAIEANVIPQLYKHLPRHQDGMTDTSVWFDDCVDSGGHLMGGNAEFGGLADAGNWDDPIYSSDEVGFRAIGRILGALD